MNFILDQFRPCYLPSPHERQTRVRYPRPYLCLYKSICNIKILFVKWWVVKLCNNVVSNLQPVIFLHAYHHQNRNQIQGCPYEKRVVLQLRHRNIFEGLAKSFRKYKKLKLRCNIAKLLCPEHRPKQVGFIKLLFIFVLLNTLLLIFVHFI